MKRIKKVILTLLPWIVVGTVGFFFYRTLATNWSNISSQFTDIWQLVNAWTLLAVVSFTAAVVVSGVLWGRLLSALAGKNINISDAVRIHSASWLLKYVPGQVGSYINKLTWGSRQGISKKTVSTSFIYENVLMVFAGSLLSIPVFILFADRLGEGLSVLLPLLVLVPMLVVATPKVFYKILNFAFEKIGRKPFKKTDFLAAKQLLRYQLGFLIPRALNGVGFVLIAASIYPIDPSMYIGLGAIYILASIVGMLAIFVPGGIGVREAVIVLFASAYLPVEQAIILSLLARLYATISDLGVAGIYLALNKGRLKQLDTGIGSKKTLTTIIVIACLAIVGLVVFGLTHQKDLRITINTDKQTYFTSEFIDLEVVLHNHSTRVSDPTPFGTCAEYQNVIINNESTNDQSGSDNMFAVCDIGHVGVEPGGIRKKTVRLDPSGLPEGEVIIRYESGSYRHDQEIITSDQIRVTIQHDNRSVDCSTFNEYETPRCAQVIVATNVGETKAQRPGRCEWIKESYLLNEDYKYIESSSSAACDGSKPTRFVFNVPHDKVRSIVKSLDDKIGNEPIVYVRSGPLKPVITAVP